jgi:hypothetical protein
MAEVKKVEKVTEFTISLNGEEMTSLARVVWASKHKDSFVLWSELFQDHFQGVADEQWGEDSSDD